MIINLSPKIREFCHLLKKNAKDGTIGMGLGITEIIPHTS